MYSIGREETAGFGTAASLAAPVVAPNTAEVAVLTTVWATLLPRPQANPFATILPMEGAEDRGLVGIATVGAVGAGGLEIALDLTGKDEAREEARRGGILQSSSIYFFRRIRRLQRGPSCLSVPFARIRFRFGKNLNQEPAPSLNLWAQAPPSLLRGKEGVKALWIKRL